VQLQPYDDEPPVLVCPDFASFSAPLRVAQWNSWTPPVATDDRDGVLPAPEMLSNGGLGEDIGRYCNTRSLHSCDTRDA
jgi:hypothetical protein